MLSIKKNIFQLGQSYRNPSLKATYQKLKLSETWSLDQLTEYQFAECKKFLIFAGQYSPYYKQLFKEIGFDPSSIKSLEALSQIPTISKTSLIQENHSIHSDYKFNRVFFSETSGTSGQVLTFQKNEAWDSANRATMFRGYSWYDVKPWDFNIYFWGYNTAPEKQRKIRLLDQLQNRFRLFDYSDESLELLIQKIKKATYLQGYSSMIYETAKLINQKKIRLDYPHLKMIKGTSEKIYPHYQEEVQKAFGKKIISEYGAAEAGIIAFECPAGNMHVNMEGVYLQEENNEIIVTNFHSYSFPIIRYRLGDFVRFAPAGTQCACGMVHPIIEEVEGRVGKNIYGKQNKYPSLTLYYVFKNLYFEHDIKLNYQCIQDEKGILNVNIENRLDENSSQKLQSEFQKYFLEDIELKIQDETPIHSRNGKLRDFISSID